MNDMLEQLKKYFSESRLKTYEEVAKFKKLPNSESVNLYKLNILICEELYSFISCIEICLRNQVNKKMIQVFNKEDWFESIPWQNTHQKQLDEAKLNVTKLKKISDNNNIISCISFGFWIHIFDSSYEQILWNKGLNKIFPNYTGSPDRRHIAKCLQNLGKIRNRIAHFEPIIKDEKDLLKNHNQMVEVINWMCPDIYQWFKSFNKFDELYNELKTNSFVSRDF